MANRTRLSRLAGTLSILGGAYLVILLFLRTFEHRFVFFPDVPSRSAGPWQPEGLPVEDVWLIARDRVKLHAWWIEGVGAEFTFLAFHGNAGNVAARADIYRFLHSLPVHVLAVEYRGYGRSEGTASEADLYLDAQAAYDYLTSERGIPADRIISFGQSLGSAVAVDLAAERRVGGVVLEGAFPSARAVARQVYPFLPGAGWVLKSRFDTAGKLASVRAPVLVVHCAHDPVLEFSLGEEVFRSAREPKFFWRVEGQCHEEACLVAPHEYRARLRALFERIKLQPG